MNCRKLVTCLSVGAVLLSFSPAPPRSATAADAQSGKVSVQILNWEQTLKLVASHKGKIVVFDAWSTSCSPCKEEFPNLVKLHKAHPTDVVCVSMSCDYAGIKNKPPEYYRERVLKFLTEQGATFDNVLSSVPSDELHEKMDLAAIPAVSVFGRDGKLVKRFDNDSIKSDSEAFTYKDVTALVDKLLAEK